MTEYWVQFDFSMTESSTESGGADKLLFQGQWIYNLPLSFPGGSPVPAALEIFYSTSVGYAGVATSPDNVEFLNYNASISNFYIVGSQPDPTVLVGPLATSPSITEFYTHQVYQYEYTTYDWALISVTGGLSEIDIAPTIADQAEGNSGLTSFSFTVTRTGDPSAESSADWSVAGSGTHPADAADFGGTLPSGTVTFGAGETSKTVVVDVSGDTTPELNESFAVTLSNPIGATIATALAKGIITNDDFPIVTISAVGGPSLSIDEGGPEGFVKAHLSNASTEDIAIHVDASPSGWNDDLTLTDFVIRAGETDVLFPVVSAKVEHFPEPIESGNLLFSTPTPGVTFSSGGNSLGLLVRDQLLQEAQDPQFKEGAEFAAKLIDYWESTTKIAIAVSEEGDELLAAAQYAKYEQALGRVAGFAGVVIDYTVVKLQFEKELVVAGTYTNTSDRANATYAAYETFDVEFTNSLMKSLLTGGAGLLATDFAVGLAVGLGLGATATAAVPVLATVAVGWTAKILYDEYLASAVKDDVKHLHEENNPREQFIQDYINNVNNNSQPTILHDGYIAGATVFVDSNGNRISDQAESVYTTDNAGSFLNADQTGPLIAFGGIDVSTGLALVGSLTAPAGSTTISPLTNLIAILQDGGVIDAAGKVLSAFGLSPTTDLTHIDAIAQTELGVANSASVYLAGAEVYETVAKMAAALAAYGVSPSEAADRLYAGLAALIDGDQLDLSNPSLLKGLFVEAAHAEAIMVPPNPIDALVAQIASANHALDDLRHSSAGNDLLEAAASIEKSSLLNHDPAGGDDFAAVRLHHSLNVSALNGVLANDADPDGSPLHVAGILGGTVGGPVHGNFGTVTISSDGSYKYTASDHPHGHGHSVTGQDVFTIKVADGQGATVEETLAITVYQPGMTYLNGTNADDTLQAGRHDARGFAIDGGPGNDNLVGGAGKDVLIGAGGNNLLTGGKGADTFYFNELSTGHNTVADLDVRNDHLELDGIRVDSVEDVDHNSTILHLDTGGTIELSNVYQFHDWLVA
ncbi:Ig-like domain-containing protein [Rhizobium ruizarguesonis]